MVLKAETKIESRPCFNKPADTEQLKTAILFHAPMWDSTSEAKTI